MSDAPVDTIDRVRANKDLQRTFLSPNLLLNPAFGRINANNKFHFADTLAKTHLRVPCWWPYGIPNNVPGTRPGAHGELNPVVTTGPGIHSLNLPNHSMSVTQYQGEVFGICQQISNANVLRGRRIRISGVYSFVGTAQLAGGISIWLKGNKLSTTSDSTTDWAAGGRGYETVRYQNQTDVRHHIQMLPGNGPTAYNGGTDILVRPLDVGESDGTHHYIRFSGTRNEADGVDTRSTTGTTLWYLDDQFPDDPTQGSKRLINDATGGTLPGGATRAFEAFVDIEDEAALFEDNECWLVVFGVDPGSVGSMTGSHQTRIESIQIQVVLDDTNDQDRVLAGILEAQASPSPWGASVMDPAYILRYPICIPAVVPLTVVNAMYSRQSSPVVADWPTDIVRVLAFYGSTGNGPTSQISVQYDGPHPNTLNPHSLLIPQATLPPGAVILASQVRLNRVAGSGTWSEVELWQKLSYDWNAGFAHEKLQLIQQHNSAAAFNDTTYDAGAFRHRVGLYWPEYTDGDLSAGILGTASIFLRIELDPDSDTTTNFSVDGGFIYYVYDPRLSLGSPVEVEP